MKAKTTPTPQIPPLAVPEMTVEELTLALAALAQPTRRAIVLQLCYGPSSVGYVAERHHISMAVASKHLRVLENAGLIAREKAAQTNYSALRSDTFRRLRFWLELVMTTHAPASGGVATLTK